MWNLCLKDLYLETHSSEVVFPMDQQLWVGVVMCLVIPVQIIYPDISLERAADRNIAGTSTKEKPASLAVNVIS